MASCALNSALGFFRQIPSGWRLTVIFGSGCFELYVDVQPALDALGRRGSIEKPDSHIFEEAVRRLRLKPDRIVHFGDEPVDDFSGAVAAGLRAVLIDGRNVHSTHANRINSLYELEAWIDAEQCEVRC